MEKKKNETVLDLGVEVLLPDPESFLKVRETLTRIGIASRKDKTLYQSVHILHKRGRYYLMSFKELFLLDGKESDLTEKDIARRNTITSLLQDWGLVKVVNPAQIENPLVPTSQIKVVSFKEKSDWKLCYKYLIGSKRA